MKQASVRHIAHISLIDLNTVSDASLTPFLDWLNPQELSRYERFQKALRKRQFLVGRVLLRWSLMQLLDLPVYSIKLTERSQNAPLLQIDEVEFPPEFSLSHTGNWVACACSTTTRLGLDIEMLNARRDLPAIARHSFQDDELQWMQRAPDLTQAFYFLWSRREARYKLTQSFVSAAGEHCYAVPHSDLSMVLMSQEALVEKPDWSELDWHKINR